jgi:hypothetical protein
MKYTVWHEIIPTFSIKAVAPTYWPHPNYEMVAEILLEGHHPDQNLEKVFELTNHIDHDWRDNPGVKVIGVIGGRHRSTSINDVVEVNGKCWICDTVGWKEISFNAANCSLHEDWELESRRHEDLLERSEGQPESKWDFLDDDEGFRT